MKSVTHHLTFIVQHSSCSLSFLHQPRPPDELEIDWWVCFDRFSLSLSLSSIAQIERWTEWGSSEGCVFGLGLPSWGLAYPVTVTVTVDTRGREGGNNDWVRGATG